MHKDKIASFNRFVLRFGVAFLIIKFYLQNVFYSGTNRCGDIVPLWIEGSTTAFAVFIEWFCLAAPYIWMQLWPHIEGAKLTKKVGTESQYVVGAAFTFGAFSITTSALSFMLFKGSDALQFTPLSAGLWKWDWPFAIIGAFLIYVTYAPVKSPSELRSQ